MPRGLALLGMRAQGDLQTFGFSLWWGLRCEAQTSGTLEASVDLLRSIWGLMTSTMVMNVVSRSPEEQTWGILLST